MNLFLFIERMQDKASEIYQIKNEIKTQTKS